MNPSAITTNIREQDNQPLSNNTILLSIPKSETMQSSCTIPIWPTLKTTRLPQTPSHTESQSLLVVDSLTLELSHEIQGDIKESNIINKLYTQKPS